MKTRGKRAASRDLQLGPREIDAGLLLTWHAIVVVNFCQQEGEIRSESDGRLALEKVADALFAWWRPNEDSYLS
jgi:hypothetical protein